MNMNTEITEDKTQEKLKRQHSSSFTQTLKICANTAKSIFFSLRKMKHLIAH